MIYLLYLALFLWATVCQLPFWFEVYLNGGKPIWAVLLIGTADMACLCYMACLVIDTIRFDLKYK